MKKLLAFMILFSCLNISAQKVYENSYLSMNIPTGWEVQNMDMPGANMEMVFFYNNVSNLGMIIGIEQKQEPGYMLRTQIENKANMLFKDASFGTIHKSSFMGKPAQSVDFETRINNEKFKGAAYAFNEGGCSIISIGCYKVGVKSFLPQIWRSIRWKQHKKDVGKYKDLRDEIKAFTEAINSVWQKSSIINNGEQAISMLLEEDEDCLIYTYRLVDYSKSQFTEEEIASLQEEVRPKIISILKKLGTQTELIKRCMDENYAFKYVYQDKNGEFLTSVKVTSDDYK